MSTLALPSLSPCPVCGAKPYCQQVEPWSPFDGPAPWAIGCYSMIPKEHFVGVNGDTRGETMEAWNSEAEKIAKGDFNVAADYTICT